MDEVRGVALVGFMGAGKTAVGERLARQLGWPHHDLDARIIQRFGPIAAGIAARGEAAFRQAEREALAALPPGPSVLSTGGGTPVDPRNRGRLEAGWRTVHLDVDLGTAAGRVGAGEGRPLWAHAQALWTERRAVYATARATVDARAPLDAVVQAALDALGPRVQRVTHGAGAYDVVLAPDFAGLGARTPPDLRVLTDDRVGPLWGPALQVELGRAPDLELPAGEANKTLETWARAVDALLGSGLRRDTAVLALGGGVVGDLAGFAASAALRGVPLIQVPTTLLAMVDSSVGGKTGVNHALGKNLVGAFHPPALVWAPLATLRTLAPRERIAGLAEVLKVGAVLDPLLLDLLEAHPDALRAGDPGLTEHVIAQAVAAKARVVAEDEREAGPRRLLNAGHTVGHALERAARYGTLLHGEAVAIGLVHEARWAAAEGLCEPELPARLATLAAHLGLPHDPPVRLDPQALHAAMAVDKKTTRDTLWLPVPVRAGVGACVPLPLARRAELLHGLVTSPPEPR